MKHYLVIEGYGDRGHPLTSAKPITQEMVYRFAPLIDAIRDFKPYEAKWGPDGKYTTLYTNNFPVSDCISSDRGELGYWELYPHIDEEVLEDFLDYVPTDNRGLHSVESIRILQVELETTLYKYKHKKPKKK